ncbi:MAG: proton-conducting transporter membrane subunit [Candidatus Hydrothermarchaeales archaeon]
MTFSTGSSILPVIAVWLPAFMAVPIYFAGKRSESLRNKLAVVTAAISFLALLALIPRVLQGIVPEFIVLPSTISPIAIEYMADPFGLVVGIVGAFAWLLATIYSIAYMEPQHAKNRYYAFLILTLHAMLGVVFAKNLFTLYVHFEVLALASWVLVIHEETEEAMTAGKKYLYMGIGGGLFLLFAVVMTYIQADVLDLNRLGLLEYQGTITYIIFVCYIIGFGTKAGMFPMHIWLPDAHPVAPAPCSALLSGVMIKAGAFGIIRTVYNIFGIELIRQMNIAVPVAILAGMGIILGSAVAISQKVLKRMLAYSSISQIGYVILGSMFLTKRGLEGSILHLFNHVLMKDALFLCAGALIFKTGMTHIDDFKGIGRKMPLTMLAFSISALSMIGFPPLAGFISKWYLLLGAMDAGSTVLAVFVAVLLISSMMNAVYYMPIIIGAYFGEAHEEIEIDEAPLVMLIPILLLALGVLLFGILPNIPLALIHPAAELLGL